MESQVVMLTTEDNPFDPFTQYTDWERFDVDHGYCSNNYLARVAVLSPDLSPADYNQAVEQAIDEIIELNLTGNYKKVVESVKEVA